MNQIEKYKGFRAELAIAETIEDIKIVESKAAAAAKFARRNKIGIGEQNQWGRFRVEIEAKKGEWLDKMFPHGGDGNSKVNSSNLRKEGITKVESTNARLVAKEKSLVDQIIERIEQEEQVVTPSLVATQVRKEKKKEAVAKKVEEHKQEVKVVDDFSIDIFKTNKKFNIIYADPAWSYWDGGEKNQSLHYETMSLEQIKALPVSNISDDNSILFLWVTFPILKDAFDVMESWGFKYSTCGFVWVKRNKNADSWFFGNGSWTRANSELCLIATKGTVTRLDASISQVIDDRVTNHSQKPERVRGLITQLVGELPRIELFSRNDNKDGWFNWAEYMTVEQKINELNARYLPQVRRILISKAYIFTTFREATLKEDQEMGFDSVLSFPDIKIPIRIRKNDYLKYMDFTVRSRVAYGGKTEIHKLMEGFGDFYFYAWTDENMFKRSNNKIISYMIIDLNIFRNSIIDKPSRKDVSNGDGSYFLCYSKQSLLESRSIKIIEHL